MVRRALLLIIGLCSAAFADTGFSNTVRVSDSGGTPACTVGQIKVSPGTLSCSGNVATVTTGGGGGGGGSTNGTINAAAQFSLPYYSLAGSSTTLSRFPGVTASTNTGVSFSTTTVTSSMTLTNVGANLPLQTDANKIVKTGPIDLSGTQVSAILGQSHLPNGSTVYINPLINNTEVTLEMGNTGSASGYVFRADASATSGTSQKAIWANATGNLGSPSYNYGFYSNATGGTQNYAYYGDASQYCLYCNTGGLRLQALSASLPVKTDTAKTLITAAIDLSGSEVTGSLPAASIAAGSLGSSVVASSFPVSGVTAGSYTNSNITVNAQGLVTSAANGTGGSGGVSVYPATSTVLADNGIRLNGINANSILKNNAAQVISSSTYQDVVNLFSACSGTQYLGADGACHTAAGASTMYSTTTIQFSCPAMAKLETNFAVNTGTATGTSNYLTCSFDNTTRQYVNGEFMVPNNVDPSGTVTIKTMGRSSTAAASKNIGWYLEHQPLANAGDNNTAYLFSTSGDLAVSGTQGLMDQLSWSVPVSSLTWTANERVNFRLSRNVGVANNLGSPYFTDLVAIEIPVTTTASAP